MQIYQNWYDIFHSPVQDLWRREINILSKLESVGNEQLVVAAEGEMSLKLIKTFIHTFKNWYDNIIDFSAYELNQ